MKYSFAWGNLCRRNRLGLSHVAGILLSALIMALTVVYIINNQETSCETSGPDSSAPINEADFLRDLDLGVAYLKSLSASAPPFEGNVVSTCINEEAAIHNFPAFMHSIINVKPTLTTSLLVFCLDAAACKACRDHGLTAAQCIYMNLGIAGNSLAPGGSDKQDQDYWRLTYGRVFATVALVRPGINAVPVDVDAIFLQNPFAPGNGIHARPHDLAVVSDIAPFTFKYGDKTPINGGFLYFPGKQSAAFRYSKEIVNRIWSKNCQPKSNEQLVTSSVLRYMSRKYAASIDYRPHMLPVEQYLNFCSTDCGTGQEFSSIGSIQDLRKLEEKWRDSEKFASCSVEGRKKWVYFHAACLNKDILQDKGEVARAKGAIQRAVYEWVSTS
jgi:hypothetical protein